MGVEVHAVTTPPSAKFKDSLRPVPMKGGAIVGYTAPLSHAEKRQPAFYKRNPRGEGFGVICGR